MPEQDQLRTRPERVSISEAARILGVSPAVVRRRIRAGEMAADRIFRERSKPLIRIRYDEVEKHAHPITASDKEAS